MKTNKNNEKLLLQNQILKGATNNNEKDFTYSVLSVWHQNILKKCIEDEESLIKFCTI